MRYAFQSAHQRDRDRRHLWLLRFWPDGYLLHPEIMWLGSPATGCTVTLPLPPGHSVTRWWNADLTLDGDTVTVRRLTYTSVDGERRTYAFGFEGQLPPGDRPRFGMDCDPEWTTPSPGA